MPTNADIRIADLPTRIGGPTLTDILPMEATDTIDYRQTWSDAVTLINNNVQITEAQVTNLPADLASKVQTAGTTTASHVPVYGASSTQVKDSGVSIDTSHNMAGLMSVSVSQDPISNLQLATKQYVDNSGDVVGPGSSVDTDIAIFSGTTGKIIKDSGVKIDASKNITEVNNITSTGNIQAVGINTTPIGAGFPAYIRGTTGEFTTGIDNTLIGQSTPRNAKFTNLTVTGTATLAADPTSALQAATKQYVDNSAGGTGDVHGPSSATDSNIAIYDGPTGKIIKNSPVFVGPSGDILGVRNFKATGVTLDHVQAAAYVTTGTISATDIVLNKVIAATSLTSDITLTFPTAFSIYTAMGGITVSISSSFCCRFINVSNFTVNLSVTDPDFTTTLFLTTAILPHTEADIIFTVSSISPLRIVLIGGTLNITGGNVVGPISSTNNTLPRYNGTTGKIIKNTSISIDDSNNVTGVNSLTLAADPTLALQAATKQYVDARGGTVTGPLVSGNQAIARFDGTTGQVIENSGAFITDDGSMGGIKNLNVGQYLQVYKGYFQCFSSQTLNAAAIVGGIIDFIPESPAGATLTLPTGGSIISALENPKNLSSITCRIMNRSAYNLILDSSGSGISWLSAGTNIPSLTYKDYIFQIVSGVIYMYG